MGIKKIVFTFFKVCCSIITNKWGTKNSYSVTSILRLEVDELRAVVPLLGHGDSVVIGTLEVVYLGHDGDQAEEVSGTIDVAGVLKLTS